MVRKSLLFTDSIAAFIHKNAFDDVSVPVFRPVGVSKVTLVRSNQQKATRIWISFCANDEIAHRFLMLITNLKSALVPRTQSDDSHPPSL